MPVNNRERLINTVHHRPVDRGLFWEEGLWPETRTRWFAEGYTEGEEFGFDRVDAAGRLNINIGYVPPWEISVVRDEGDYQLIRNKYGIKQRVSKTVRGDIAQYVSFPVAGRDGWERLRDRLDPNASNRFPDGWSARFENLRRNGIPITFGSGHLSGFFSFVRELVGDEEAGYPGLSGLPFDDAPGPSTRPGSSRPDVYLGGHVLQEWAAHQSLPFLGISPRSLPENHRIRH